MNIYSHVLPGIKQLAANKLTNILTPSAVHPI